MSQQSPSKTHTYFSRSQGLIISADKGKQLQQDGQVVRIGEKIIGFQPNGDGFGVFRTDEPDLIEFMDNRVREVGDVFGPDEHYKLSVPLSTQVSDLQRLLQDQQRTIETQNRLVQELQRPGGKLAKREDPVTA